MTFETERLVLPLRMRPVRKAVLMLLARRARSNGEAWPGIVSICKDLSYSRTAVIEALGWLERERYITVDRKAGCGNRYRINFGHLQPSPEAVTAESPESEQVHAADRAPVHPNSSAASAAVPQVDQSSARSAPEPVRVRDERRTPCTLESHMVPVKYKKSAGAFVMHAVRGGQWTSNGEPAYSARVPFGNWAWKRSLLRPYISDVSGLVKWGGLYAGRGRDQER